MAAASQLTTATSGGNTNAIEWQASNFFANNEPLILGSRTADSTTIWSNGLGLANANAATVNREIRVIDNPATNGDYAVIANNIMNRGDNSSGTTGTRSLTKTGDGTLVLAGLNNTYNGTITVAQGTLRIDGTLNTQTAPVIVNSGATLGGTGTVNRPVIVNSGGTLAPGASSGLFTVQNLTLASNATFAVELGLIYDQVLVTGASASVSNSILALSWTTAPTGGDKFLILSNDTPSTVFGEFTGWSNLSTQLVSGVGFEINYFAGNGNDILLSVIPEPSALTLVGAGLLMMLAVRRRSVFR